jgi:hypothetical protein
MPVENLIADQELDGAKADVAAMGAVDKARGPGGGLKPAGVNPPAPASPV